MTTMLELKTDLEAELNIDVTYKETVTETELRAVVNRYIKESALVVYPLIQDYYLTSDVMSLVAATADYAMPTGIYANKIRYIQFDDGTEDYVVKTLPLSKIPDVQSTDDFTYRLHRAVASVMQMRMYPTPSANDVTSVIRHFTRVPTVVTVNSDIIDLPDTTLCYHRVKLYCMKKMNHPMYESEFAQLGYYQNLFKTNLQDMIPDSDETMDEDFSHYEEHI